MRQLVRASRVVRSAVAGAAAAHRRPDLLAIQLRSQSKPAIRAARLRSIAAMNACRAAAGSSLLVPADALQQASYAEAQAASLSRTQLRFEDLVEQLSSSSSAAATGADSKQTAGQLQRQRQQLEDAAVLTSFQGAAAGRLEDEAVCARVDAEMEEWQAVAHQRPAGFDSQAQLTLPGVAGEGRVRGALSDMLCLLATHASVPATNFQPALGPHLPTSCCADVAVVTRGGRSHGFWKGANQDAHSLTAPAPGTVAVVVADGHGRRGENASRAAVDWMAQALPAALAEAAGLNGSSSGGAASALQCALVAACERVGGSMERDVAFKECGAAVVACLLREDRSVLGALQEVGGHRTLAACCLPAAVHGARCSRHATENCDASRPVCPALRGGVALEPGVQPEFAVNVPALPLLRSLTVAWAGDCRATIGLCLPSPRGPRWLVHPLTQDHKPGRWARAAGLHVRLLRQVSSRACFVGAMTS